MGELLSRRLDDPDANPYFLWSETLTVAELRSILAGERGRDEQLVYMARVLREARYDDVWKFLTPEQVAANWDGLQRRLGRMRGFWSYLLTTWREHGLLAG
jgi:hypothetical protein